MIVKGNYTNVRGLCLFGYESSVINMCSINRQERWCCEDATSAEGLGTVLFKEAAKARHRLRGPLSGPDRVIQQQGSHQFTKIHPIESPVGFYP